MRHLNYNHLLYFWTVSREGSITGASESLHLTPQTVSAQIKLLEESIGQPLFKRAGRGLVLTDTGRIVQEYADEIFSTGIELAQHIRGDEAYRSQSLRVGIVNSMPRRNGMIGNDEIEPMNRKISEQVIQACLLTRDPDRRRSA